LGGIGKFLVSFIDTGRKFIPHPADAGGAISAGIGLGRKIAQFPHITNVCPSDEPLPVVPGMASLRLADAF